MTEVEQLQEETLTILADGGFADKRTPVEAWTMARDSAKRHRDLLDKAHARLVALGDHRGVLALASR